MTAPERAPRVVAVGAGRMGRGIAIAFAYAGHRIALVDLRRRSPDAWNKLEGEARDEIAGALQSLVQLGALPAALVDAVAQRIDLVDASRAPAVLGEADV